MQHDIIIVNVGLVTNEGKPVELKQALRVIDDAGLNVLSAFIAVGEWEGKPEPCLVVKGTEWRTFNGAEVSAALVQDCIAVWKQGKGGLVPSQAFPFSLDHFHFHFKP